MRTTVKFVVTGTSKVDIETKTKQAVASYYGVDAADVEKYIDIELSVTFENEQATGSVTTKVKKNYDTGK